MAAVCFVNDTHETCIRTEWLGTTTSECDVSARWVEELNEVVVAHDVDGVTRVATSPHYRVLTALGGPRALSASMTSTTSGYGRLSSVSCHPDRQAERGRARAHLQGTTPSVTPSPPRGGALPKRKSQRESALTHLPSLETCVLSTPTRDGNSSTIK